MTFRLAARISTLSLFFVLFLFSIFAAAMNGRTTYQARIVKPDGYPLESANVNFRFSVLDVTGSCVMYVEDYAAVNMTSSGGLISFALGTGVVSFPASSTATTFSTMFDNSITSFSCQSPGIYNPIPTDNRKIVMQFNDGNGWQTLPAMVINAVPYAMYAAKSQDSQKLNGKADTAFLQKASDIPTCTSDKMLYFNGVSFSCVTYSAGGSGITSVTTSGTVLTTGGTASAPVISIKAVTMSQDGYLTSLDYAEFKAKLAASSTQIVNTLGYAPVSGAAVATQINNSNLSGDVSGTISSNSVVSVGGKTAAQISTSVNDTLAATSSNTASTIVKRDSSGNFTANDIYANAAKINYVDIYRPSTSFNIRLQAPTSLSTNYVLNLPTTSGTTGQVLSTDGSGNLSWINPSTGSVVSVSATAPLASTGGSNPTISITQANSTTNGYLSSTDWNTFNNKQAATSAAIIATLGYTPADNAASGTYAQKASNLSDLASIATARTNLGLGTLATANSIDLGSASATGIIADARLANQSGVTSGTQYTKVTVDGKGRVTSGAQLSSSDVTTALGYTPANSTSGVTSLNGSVSQTQTFASSNAGTAFGISTSNGVHTFAIPLAASSSVTAGLLSNADYTTFTNKQNATSAAIIATLGYTPANATSATQWTTNGSNIYYNTGNIGVGIVNPSAKLELASGTASVAPLKFTSGTLLSSAQSGTMEYDGFNFYLTDSTNTRRTIATGSSAGTIDNASNINSSGNITMTPVGSVIVSSTTASTNSNTGALVVKGGLGVAGTTNIGGNLNVSGSSVIDGTLKLSSMTSGSVLFAGANGTVSQDNANFYWDNTNKRLGVGTTTPGSQLSINRNISSDSIWVGQLGLDSPVMTSNTVQTRIVMGSVGRIEGVVENAATPTGGLAFATRESGGAVSEKMRILSSGNVGIGTTSPGSKLTINGGGLQSDGLVAPGGGVPANGLLWAHNIAGGYIYAAETGNDSDVGFGVSAGGVGRFFIDTTGGRNRLHSPYSYNLTLNETGGNVGIGTSAPSQKLEVASGSVVFNANSDSGNYIYLGGPGSNSKISTGGSNDWIKLDSGFNIQLTSANINMNTPVVALNSQLSFKPGLAPDYITDDNLTDIYYGNDYTTPMTFSGRAKTATQFIFNRKIASSTGQLFSVLESGISRFAIDSSGNVGIGTSTPTAKLHLAAGTTSNASLKMTSGTLLSSAQDGAIEYDGTNLYYTDSTNTRRALASTGGGSGQTFSGTNTFTGQVNVSNNTASTNSSTGAFVVSGGVGIGGALNVAGAVSFGSTLNVTGQISGSSRVLATGFRANQGVPDSNDSSTNGYAFGIDGDTGLFSPGSGAANGVLAFYSNNSEKMRIDSGGNVGIGMSSPTHKLDIMGDNNQIRLSTNGAYASIYPYHSGVNTGAMYWSSTGDAVLEGRTAAGRIIFGTGGTSVERMRIDSSGNVGIGTNAPTQKLHLVGDNLYQVMQSAGTDGPVLQAQQSRGTTAARTATLSGDVMLDVRARGYDGNAFESSPSSQISFTATENHTATATGGKISFLTTSNTTNFPLTRMTIDHNGNVGIGTTSPTSKLSILASSGTAQTITQSSATGYGLVVVPGADTTYDALTINNAANSVNRHRFLGGGDVYLALGAGNVGIGTISPSVKLQVAGPISHPNEVLGVASFYDGGTQAYFKVLTKIPWMGGNGSAAQIRVRGYGYGSPDFDTTISWYEWTNTFYSPGTVTKFHSAIGTRTPSRVRMGVWNDAGTNRVAVEIANDSVYWSSYSVDLYKHAGLSDSYASGWTTSAGAFDATITNITDVPQVGPVVQSNSGNVGIGTTSPAYKLDVAGSGNFSTSAAGGIELSLGNTTMTSTNKRLRFIQDNASTVTRVSNNTDSIIYMSYQMDTGNVGIGTTAPGYTLHVVGTAGLSTGTAWTNASDIRLKDIQGDYEYGLSEVLKLHTVRYNYKKGNALGLPSDFSKTGFIAQEVQKVIPDAVNVRKDGYLELNVDPIHWAVVNAVKDLYKLVVEIKNEILGEVRGLASVVESKADKAQTDAKIKQLEEKAAEVDVLKAENAELKAKDEAKSKRLKSLEAYLCSKDPAAPICK